MDAEVAVHGQHHQGHQGRPHDGGHEALHCAAGEGPHPVVSWALHNAASVSSRARFLLI